MLLLGWDGPGLLVGIIVPVMPTWVLGWVPDLPFPFVYGHILAWPPSNTICYGVRRLKGENHRHTNAPSRGLDATMVLPST